ncbi:MAG: peptide chain release factor N(5)-glutamine methyltransferase [Treponema sp.]|nr:peptide chain release factor N(5)-glutamine methyltransferase [Treponema sp.]
MTIREFKTESIKQLSLSPLSHSPALDIDVLLMHKLNLTKTALLLNYNIELQKEDIIWLENAIQKRINGLPIAYITGHKDFYGFDFIVTPDVLIPKPDTEILVEKAIEKITYILSKKEKKSPKICDMCTGSGCIAISVFKSLLENKNILPEELPSFYLVDISQKALEIAKRNAAKLLNYKGDRDNYSDNYPIKKYKGDRDSPLESPIPSSKITFIQSNLFQNITTSFDIILTNPPYVPSSMTDELLSDGRNEPRLALDGDVCDNGDRDKSNDGLSIIRRLIPQAKKHLNPNGFILMETGEYNAKAAALIAECYGFTSKIYKDLEGQLRVLELN